MAQEVLNQDEIDALLNGVDAGAVSTEPAPAPGDTRTYDFSSEMRIVRGRMPTLEMVNERLARQLRISLYNLLRRTVELSVGQVTMKKFSEYTHSLSLPVNLNLVKVNPLRGTALFVLDPKLVFALVDNFFGGVGRHAKIEGREFSATEMRIVQTLLRAAFADMKEAWTPIAAIDVEYQHSEINPNFASIVTPSEVVVVCPFQIELDGGGGSLHIVMPYSMIEPLREVLDSGVQADRAEQDERWLASLKDGLQDAEVELTTVLGGGSVSLSKLVELKPGDVLPCDFAGKATVLAEGVPLFRGAFGVSRGQQCVRYEQRVRRPSARPADASLLRKNS
ncbi:MAG TPA: flagellar motor switch protein FliM [Steroidobacteraceae bacterium]|nr:flagellar motor switch protein FliM [Steroidobacteraceae bacterium]